MSAWRSWSPLVLVSALLMDPVSIMGFRT
jgi:hypothetical protein